MKRTIFILITITLLFSLFATAAFAAESEPGAELPEEKSEYTEDTADGGVNAEENIFDIFFSAICEYSGEILSAVLALLSGIVIFAYRKGILPLLSGGLKAVDTEVKEIEKHSKSQSETTLAISNTLGEGLASANELLSSLQERILVAENTYKDTDEVFSVLSMQIEMLCEIFMSSSLPAYEKERVAERISKMKACLPQKTGECENA